MTATLTEFPIVVDYGQSLEQMIEAGRYGCSDEAITAEHFPITGEGKVTNHVVLIQFDRDIISEDAISTMREMGLEPGKIEHLLAYGAQHWQRDPKLVTTLGSVWAGLGDGPCIPYLDGCFSRRNLYLGWWAGNWKVSYSWYFLAVCKVN